MDTDKEKSVSELTDEEILQKMLDVEAVPERTVLLKRIGIPVTMRGLTGKQVNSIRERCTTTTFKFVHLFPKCNSSLRVITCTRHQH